MKYLLFGTGDYYERYKKWFNHEEVLALLDNSSAKQGSIIDRIQVLSPAEGVKLPFDVIVILSFYVKSMKQQLMDLGVFESRIYHFYDLHQLIYKKEIRKPIQFYGDAEKVIKSEARFGQKILLLSHDMTFGGPAIALFHVAKVLAAHGYQVVFASMLDGPLREKLLDYNIPVIVDVNLQIQTMNDADWTSHFSLLFCNTINFHVFLSERNSNIPVIWWLHDSEFFYHGVKSEVLKSTDTNNLRVCSVGSVPEKAMHSILPKLPIERLLYGVSDSVDGKNRIHKSIREEKEKKVCFVSIGYIEERKGQDILIHAIRKLPNEMRKKAVFYLVGQNSSMMARRLYIETSQMSEIVMTGTVNRETINEILDGADALICPSREDPMPTVVAEAMMHSVPCIVSNATGTALYIQDGIDGFVFPSEDVHELAAKIEWCIEHNEKLKHIGAQSRRIYENYFSMDVFERNLLETVNDVLTEE